MPAKPAKSPTARSGGTGWTLKTTLAALRAAGSPENVEGRARFGITTAGAAYGVPMPVIQALGREIGKDHVLAAELWASGVYDARLLAAYVAEPAKVTRAEMDAWCGAFDSWAVCDTACFALWWHVPLAWDRIRAWAKRDEEYVKRAAFALIASVALHDKRADEAAIERELVAAIALCEKAARDPRNFVKKGVSWALRSIGSRSSALRDRALASGARLAKSSDATERWIGKDVVKDLERPLVIARVAKKDAQRAQRATKTAKAAKATAKR